MRRPALSHEEGSRISRSRSLWGCDTQRPNHTVSFEPEALRKRKANIAAHRMGKRQKWQWFLEQSRVAKPSFFYPGRSLIGIMVFALNR
jgi:hypothetical protein